MNANLLTTRKIEQAAQREARWILSFATHARPSLAQVGGKAHSLILMTRHGLPVPPGCVLTVDFFTPWLESIKATPAWAAVLASDDASLKVRCDAVKAICLELALDAERDAALNAAVDALRLGGGNGRAPCFSVRSSAPEEDLEGASFAGGYETTLGVTPDGVLDAVRRSFASCFDARVLVYKREHGFDATQPRIAVIVQRQIAADSAGVAFSLNPVNNCYDEAVINANFGLGETVVSGQVSPDSFTVDKLDQRILQREIGKKEAVIWLGEQAGTRSEPGPGLELACVSDEQVRAITALCMRAEELYDKPVDIEWAYADGELYLLQARPITAYFPLPETLRTAPGAPRRLYGDLTLIKWGMQDLMSVMGMSQLERAMLAMLRLTMRNLTAEDVWMMRVVVDGRTYFNLSNTMKLYGQKRAVSTFGTMDTLGAEIIANLDADEYLPDQMPPPLRGLLFKVLWQNVSTVWDTLQVYRHPRQYEQQHLTAVARLRSEHQRLAATAATHSLSAFTDATVQVLMDYMSEAFMASIAAAELARARIKRLFRNDPPEVRDKVVYLERALPHNITVQMGLAMYRLASFPQITQCASPEAFLQRLEARDFPPDFLEAWDGFMADYGFRSPMEMDVAAPRYTDQPGRLYAQLRSMAEHSDTQTNPQAVFERAVREREEAFNELLEVAQAKGRRQAKQFRRQYALLMAHGGFREMPKYLLVEETGMIRRRALALGEVLMGNGRLDHAAQIFDLTLEQADQAQIDPTLDLRRLAAENTRYQNRLAHVRNFPRIVDSRGKIFHAPVREAGPNEFAAQPISPGIARGPVKVLHSPDDKPVDPGDILVARATDPGWTPLFLNAAGIILEVGGLLQHGALVAREYGKPCVAGLEDATTLLQDGQMVELDGARGIVRLLDTPENAA